MKTKERMIEVFSQEGSVIENLPGTYEFKEYKKEKIKVKK